MKRSRSSIRVLFVFILSLFLLANPSQGFAQGTNKEAEAEVGGPRKQLATIIFAGLGGAILGLSTLSFSGRPQDNLKNIAIGFAIGVIGGTAYATYNAAMRPDLFYGEDYGASLDRDFQKFYSPRAKVIGPIYYNWSF